MSAEHGVCPPEWEARLDELCEHFPFAAESHVLRMLWSLEVYFPPCLVRPGRRLPVQGLSEGSLGYLDRLPMLTAAQGQTPGRRRVPVGVFGLWRVLFPPCLVRPGRRLPVQGLSEESLGFRDRLPA